MAWEIYEFTATVPAGTSQNNLYAQNLTMPSLIVQKIQILVPPGPRGTVGFQLGFAGQQLIPYTNGSFVITDDDKIEFDIENAPDTGAWQFFGYNSGSFDHSIYIRFLTVPIGTNAPVTGPNIIPAQNLSGGVNV